MTSDFHVIHSGKGWLVKVREPFGQSLAAFKRRGVAEAYGRALAHRHKVGLIIHFRDGSRVRRSAGTLTYSQHLV